MKRVLHFTIIVIALAFASCTGRGGRYMAALERTDSIADAEPRRALGMLDSLAPLLGEATEAERNLGSLIRVKAEDKAFIPHKTDTLMLRLVSYYETDGDKRWLPMAYYYAGRVYRDINDNMRALPYFEKTAELADSTDYLRYKAYSQMGYIFLYQGLYCKGFDAFRRSYIYNKVKGNKASQAYALCGMANCLQRNDNEAKVMPYFDRAYKLAKEVDDKSLKAEIIGQIAYCYYKLGQYHKAEQSIIIALNGADSINQRAIYATASDIYNALGKEEKALKLNKKLYAINDVYAKQSSSKWLGHYYLKHDLAKASFYLDEFEKYTDSIQVIKQTESVAKIDAMYNYSQRANENARLKNEIRERNHTIKITLALAFVIIFALTTVMLYINRKRQEESRKLRNEQLFRTLEHEQSKEFVEENNKKIRDLKQRLANSADENEALVFALKTKEEQLKNQNKVARIIEHNRALAKAGLENSDICNKIFTILNDDSIKDADKKLPREYWRQLDEEVNSHYDKFRERILDLCHVSTLEYHVCLLLKIKVKPKGISVLVCKTKSSVSAIRKRLYFKAFGKDEQPEKWDDFIASL